MTRTAAVRRTPVNVLFPALLALTMAAPAFAQRGGGGGRGRGGAGAGGDAPAYQATRLEILTSDFKLTKDQKKSVKTILDAAHKSAGPIREALTRTHEAMAAAVQASAAQKDIDAASGQYAEQAAAMALLEMKSLAEILQALDADQRANTPALRSAFFLMRGMFLDSKKWDEAPEGRLY
jgi:hypothetical protein